MLVVSSPGTIVCLFLVYFVLLSFLFFNSFYISFLICSYFQHLFLWFVVKLFLSSFMICFVLSFLSFSKFLLSSLRRLEFCFFSLIFRTFSRCSWSFFSFFHPLFCSFHPSSFWALPIYLTAFRALFLFIFIRSSSCFRYFFCPFSLLSSMLVICRRKRLEPLLCAIPSNPERVWQHCVSIWMTERAMLGSLNTQLLTARLR